MKLRNGKILNSGMRDPYINITLQKFGLQHDNITVFIYMTVLKLSSIQLINLPSEIFILYNLKELIVCNNFIKIIPPDIGKLKNLNILDISNNHITSLPPTIGKLKSLQYLSIQYNHISELPLTIGNMTNLKSLSAYWNNINTIPPTIENMSNLERLIIDNNCITFLPKEICNLQSINEINVSHNMITELPYNITCLPNLLILDISFNKLYTISLNPIISERLFFLNVNDNPFIHFNALFKCISYFTRVACLYLQDTNYYFNIPLFLHYRQLFTTTINNITLYSVIEWKQKILQKILIYSIQNQNTITTFIKWAHTPPNGLIIKRLLKLD